MRNDIVIKLYDSDVIPRRCTNADELNYQYLIIESDNSYKIVSPFYHSSGYFLCFINTRGLYDLSEDKNRINDYPEKGIYPNQYKFWGKIPSVHELNLE